MKMYVVIREENLTDNVIYCGAPCMSLEEAEQIVYSRFTNPAERFPDNTFVEYYKEDNTMSGDPLYYYYIREIEL